MKVSTATKQRLTFAAILLAVICATHFAYAYIYPQWILYRKAENYFMQKMWPEAIVLYEQSLALAGDNPAAMQKIAESYAKVNNFPKAIYWYKSYLKLRPDEIWAHRALAGALTANGEFDQAAKEYEYILSKQQTKSSTHD